MELPVLIPQLSRKTTLYGKLIDERIIVFLDSKRDGYTILGRFEPPNKVWFKDGRVSMVIMLPRISKPRRFVSVSTNSRTFFEKALEEFSEDNLDKITLNPPLTQQPYRSYYFPKLLVYLSRMTSLSIESSRELLLSDLSMTLSVRNFGFRSTTIEKFDFYFGLLIFFILFRNWSFLSHLMYENLGYEVQSETLKDHVQFVLSRHAPLGFKLNPQIDIILGSLVIMVIDIWHFITSRLLAPYAKELFVILYSITCYFNYGAGFSFLLAIAFDTVSFLVTHVAVLHRVISRILRIQLAFLSSLTLLMRGRKKNPLRKRVDTLQTDSAQLMLGTMILFFFGFIFQTTLAYHLLVLSIWFLVFSVETILFSFLVMYKTFPYDVLVIAIKERFSCTGYNGAIRPKSYRLTIAGDLTCWTVYVLPESIQDVLATWIKNVNTIWKNSWQNRWGDRKIFFDVLFGSELPSVPVIASTV